MKNRQTELWFRSQWNRRAVRRMVLETGKELLRGLEAIYRPGEDDGFELAISSESHYGAFIYPRAGMSLGQISLAFDLIRLEGGIRAPLFLLFRHIPSSRCAVRLSDKYGASLFWPIDVEAKAISRIAEALHFSLFASKIRTHLERTHQPACGLALEMSCSGQARLRCYQMLDDMEACEGLLRTLRGGHEFSPSVLTDMEKAIRAFGFSNSVVVNFSSDVKGALSVKLEFADAPLSPMVNELVLNRHEIRFWRRAALEAARLDAARFNYIGIRYCGNGSRSFTAYLDAHRLLETRGWQEPL